MELEGETQLPREESSVRSLSVLFLLIWGIVALVLLLEAFPVFLGVGVVVHCTSRMEHTVWGGTGG